MSTITITYGERVENHIGNQQIGNIAESGLSTKKLKNIEKKLKKDGYNCRYIDLNSMLNNSSDDTDNSDGVQDIENAGVLIVKNFVETFFDDDAESEIYEELVNLNWDKKALMRGEVKNKHARWRKRVGS